MTQFAQKVVQTFEQNVKRIESLRYLNAFITENIHSAREQCKDSSRRHQKGCALGELDGVTFTVKDNLCTEGIPTTCGSKFLKGFVPPYTATAVSRLLSSGSILLGKTNMDEFAMGAGSQFSHFGPVQHPISASRGQSSGEEYVSGGSSGGSAVSVATNMCTFSLGSDTGGSVRIPASFCGVVGLKPSYGRVSRYGLIPLASSLDTVGVFSCNVTTAALVLDTIAGKDENDPSTTSLPHQPCFPYMEAVPDVISGLKGIKIAILKDSERYGCHGDYNFIMGKTAEWLRGRGSEITEVELPHIQYGVSTYYTICVAEASSNMAKYNGLVYGHASEREAKLADHQFAYNRMEGVGPVVQHRIITGTYFLSYRGRHHFERAVKMRRLIYQDFENLLSKHYDVLITPTTVGPAPSVSSFHQLGPVQSNVYDTFTVPVSLAGLPAVSIPIDSTYQGLPIGLQLVAWQFEENKLLKVARGLEIMTNKTPNVTTSA